jgi:hypothetical protein
LRLQKHPLKHPQRADKHFALLTDFYL